MSDSATNYNEDVPFYDRCGGSAIGSYNSFNDVVEAGDTKWTVIFTFNTIVYACMIAFGLCQIIGTFFAPMCFLAYCGHCFLASAHIACIVVTGVFRYQDEGEKCAKNGADLGGDFDWTFKDHGDAIQGLFISQCVLLILINCLWICSCQASSAIAIELRERGTAKNKA